MTALRIETIVIEAGFACSIAGLLACWIVDQRARQRAKTSIVIDQHEVREYAAIARSDVDNSTIASDRSL